MNSNLISKLPSYEVSRQVLIKSSRVSAIFYFLVVVLAGGSLATFAYQGGYNIFYPMQGTVSAQLQGSGYTTVYTDDESYKKIQDGVDLVPSTESNAITMATSLSTIFNQSREKKESSQTCDSEIDCFSDNECVNSSSTIGKITGKCGTSRKCLLEGWCPARFPKSEEIEGIQNNIRFNIRVNCFYNEKEKHYNSITITLEELLRKGGIEFQKVKDKGALFNVIINYNCNVSNRSACNPDIKLIRLDDDENHKGFLSYIASYSKPKDYIEDGKDFYYRDLHKITGLRFVFKIDGSMAEFSFEKLFLGLGSAIGLVGLAGIIVESLILGWLEESKQYASKICIDLDEEKILLENMCKRAVEKTLSGESGNIHHKQ